LSYARNSHITYHTHKSLPMVEESLYRFESLLYLLHNGRHSRILHSLQGEPMRLERTVPSHIFGCEHRLLTAPVERRVVE